MNTRIIAPLGCTIAGLALGFVLGWFLKPTPAAIAQATASAVQQPSGNLTKENAHKLIEASYSDTNDPSMNCAVGDIDNARSSSLMFGTYDELHQRCIAQLEKAEILIPGECLDRGCSGGCCKRAVKPGSKARATEKGLVTFACGKFNVLGVSSVTTQGNKATVKFSREFVADVAVLGPVGDCRLQIPDKGRAEKTWEFTRDDDGNWRAMR